MSTTSPNPAAFSPSAEQRLADLRMVADLAGQGLVVTDPALNRFVACNAIACEQLGYSPAELLELGPHLIQADPDHNAAWAQQEATAILLSGQGRIATRHRAKDGTVMEVWTHHSAVALDGRELIVTLVVDPSQERFRDFEQQQEIQLHRQAEAISEIGAWSLRLSDGRMQLSALAARICQLPPHGPQTTLWGFTGLVHRDDRSRWRADLRRSIARGDALQGRYRLDLLEQPPRTVQVEGRVVLDDEGRALQLNGTIEDVSHAESSSGNLERLRRLDPLTQLANKQGLVEVLQGKLAGRGYSQSLAVLSLDLDGFQEINDGFGTDTGDALLQAVGAALGQLCGGDAELARIGSDEFALVLERPIHSLGDALRYAQRLEQRWATLPPLVSGLEANPSFCLGLACYPEHAQKAETLLQSANTALMQAKRQGRGQICPYSSTLSRQIRERLDLSAELASAIERQQLHLQLQPQVSSAGTLVGAEMLLRWTNSRGVAISPAQFIDLAEQSGQIFALGRWVLHQTLQQMQIWQEQGLAVPRIAINLSARELERPSDQLLGGLNEALAAHGIRADQLELEITETALLRNPLQARQKLSQLAQQGFRIAIDDFGTGYSSLELLRSLPIHKLKIDKTFIDGVVHSPADATIVRSIITLAEGLGLACVAEGVERADQLQTLQQLGCDVVQGYCYSKPLDLDVFTAALSHRGNGGPMAFSVESNEPSCPLPLRHLDDPASRVPSPMEQMELWRGAIELSQNCYLLLRAELDSDGNVIDFLMIDLNQATSDYFQQPKEAFIGQLLLSMFPNVASTGLMQVYTNAIQTNRAVLLEGFAYPNHELLKDDRFYDVSIFPLRGFLVVDWRDVTSRLRMNTNLAETAQRYQLLAENIVEVVVLLDAQQRIAWVSPSLQPLTGWSPLQWQGQPFAAFFGSDAGEPAPVDLEQWMAQHGEIRQDRLRLKDPIGNWSWVALSAKRLEPADTPEASGGYVLTLQPVDELVVQEQHLLKLAHRDPLTGLETRGAILGWLRERLEDERALRSQPLAMLFCDFDNFKQINDGLGHAAGDLVLQTIAARIRHLVRNQDHAGRLGGDEFLVLLEGVKTLEAASLIADKLRQAIAEPIPWQNSTIHTSVSIGVALHAAGEDADAFLGRADEAMYAAKSEGRNRVTAL